MSHWDASNGMSQLQFLGVEGVGWERKTLITYLPMNNRKKKNEMPFCVEGSYIFLVQFIFGF